MYGITNASGSASAKGFIQTTYPEGFICICSNGTRTLKARDTSGYMMFVLPAIGKWTVTATDPADPTNTDSETVEITTEGQSLSVELSYVRWLFKDGKQYENVTGGWGTTGYSVSGYSLTEPTISTSGIKLATNGTANGSWTGTQNSVDLSAIDRVEVSSVDIIDGFYLIINKTKTALASGATASLYVTEPGSNSLDVSALSGSYYIALSCFGGTSNPKRGATVESVELL